ncbi:tumor necrosis factor receptor superfamily member 26-like isoform 2-T2 [Sarcophilus harrisii]
MARGFQGPRSAARAHPYLCAALLVLLGLACIPTLARAQDMTMSESTLNQKDPMPKVTCDPEEYSHGTHCCLPCPPGTGVVKPCASQGTLGVCEKCPLGKYSHKNHCQPCTRCREEQEMVIPCHRESDTRCRCKARDYCEGQNCTTCRPCRTRCPEGEELLQGCTNTTDIVCGVPTTGGPNNSWLWLLLLILPIVAMVGFIIWDVRKWKSSRSRPSWAVTVEGQVNSPRPSTASEGATGQPLLTQMLEIENEINCRQREEEGGQRTATASQSPCLSPSQGGIHSGLDLQQPLPDGSQVLQQLQGVLGRSPGS